MSVIDNYNQAWNILFLFYFISMTPLSKAISVRKAQGVKERCRVTWLTNSAVVYKPKCWGGFYLEADLSANHLYVLT
jgi:hypothetical protein